MAKNWGFLLTAFKLNQGKEEVAGDFEADGISPFKFAAGTQSAVMESEKYDNLTNAMAMADFIDKIGDKRCLSIKKKRCPVSLLFVEANIKKMALPGIYLSVSSLSTISSQLQGDQRKRVMITNSLELLKLINVSVPYAWIQPAVAGYDGYLYDYISFEVKGRVERLFKEKDY